MDTETDIWQQAKGHLGQLSIRRQKPGGSPAPREMKPEVTAVSFFCASGVVGSSLLGQFKQALHPTPDTHRASTAPPLTEWSALFQGPWRDVQHNRNPEPPPALGTVVSHQAMVTGPCPRKSWQTMAITPVPSEGRVSRQVLLAK